LPHSCPQLVRDCGTSVRLLARSAGHGRASFSKTHYSLMKTYPPCIIVNFIDVTKRKHVKTKSKQSIIYLINNQYINIKFPAVLWNILARQRVADPLPLLLRQWQKQAI